MRGPYCRWLVLSGREVVVVELVGGDFPSIRCIHMEKDGNGGSEWVYE